MGKKWMTAACVLLTAFVLASCGDREVPAEKTTETVVEKPDIEGISESGESVNDTAGSSSDSTNGKNRDENSDSSNKKEGDTNGGDHALTGQKWEWVYWDSDQDGEEEQISFEYVDNGDEAESFVLVRLEVGGSSEAYIDRAGRIVRISDKEDAEGPYLLVEYNYENVFSEKADMNCIVRIRDGAVIVE